jgi:hypothetical protein
VPVLDGDNAIASLACHYTAAHTPSRLDIERNEVIAKLIAISLKGKTPVIFPKPLFAWPPNKEQHLDNVLPAVR